MRDFGNNLAPSTTREPTKSKTFSLDDNPFRVLKANYRSSVADISHLVEDAELDGIYQEEELQRARQALITPRSRLMLELTWLPELSQLQTTKLYNLLRNADPAAILSQVDHFPELTRANIAAHLCSHGSSSVEVVHSLAQCWDEIDEAHLLTFINEERHSCGFPKVEVIQLNEALRDIRQRHAAAAADWIWSVSEPGAIMNTIVEQELDNNPESSFLRHLVEIYDRESEPHLAAIKDSIIAATAAAAEVPQDIASHTNNIKQELEAWDAINQPVQLYSQFLGQEEGRSKQIYEIVRTLCLELANDHGRYEEALELSSALLKTFPELESVAESLKDDIKALESLADQKKLSDQLNPLIEACARAKDNSASFSKYLKFCGFTEASGKILSDVVESFNTARRVLPEPGVAYLVVRDLALSLNNDSNDPQSAFLLVDGLIKIGGDKVPRNVMKKLHEERSLLHKNWKMKELQGKSGNLSAMLKIVDEMLVHADATDRQEILQLKSKIEKKKFANLVRNLIYGIITLVILVAISGGL